MSTWTVGKNLMKNHYHLCIEIYGLDPSYFHSAPGLAWKACSKKTDLKLELLTDYYVIDG